MMIVPPLIVRARINRLALRFGINLAKALVPEWPFHGDGSGVPIDWRTVMKNDIRFEHMSVQDLARAVDEGQLSRDHMNEILQERQRRAAATREKTPDSTDHETVSGFGSGQGMGATRTGQGPSTPDERGFPRGEDPDWPT